MSAAALTSLAVAESRPRSTRLRRVIEAHRGLVTALGVLVLAILALRLSMATGFGLSDLSATSSSTAALALAAIGQTIVIISGGLDLSAGAVISLANAVLVTQGGESGLSTAVWSLAAIAAGALVGLTNGLLVVKARLQPVVVTLSTMFIVQGATLLILKQPGGSVPASLTTALTGDLLGGLLPMPLIVILGALLLWTLIRKSKLGLVIYAVGSDEGASHLKGLPVAQGKVAAFTIAGAFYGAAGVFLTAQTATGDPLVGAAMLLPIFVATVLGGTPLTGGRGGCVGTVAGAFTVTLIANVLLLANVSTYYSTVVEGSILILAVLVASLHPGSTFQRHLVQLRHWVHGLHAPKAAGTAGAVAVPPPSMASITATSEDRSGSQLVAPNRSRWLDGSLLRLMLPSCAGLLLLIALTAILFRQSFSPASYFTSLFVLTSFLAVLAAGQGAVVISGGLDLSVPYTMTLAAVLLTGLTNGSDGVALWAIPAVLTVGMLVGLINGIGVALVGISPFLMTLAMNGILQGVTLVYSNGSPTGLAPAALRWLMTGRWLGVPPVILLLPFFVLGAVLLLHRSVYGRRLFATGSNPTAARFAGAPVPQTLLATYAFSGLCSAVVGVMLAGFSGQAFNDMGDPYLLSSIAVVVVGGTSMRGGRGHYLGMLGGAMMLTALATLLSGTVLPPAARSIVLGVVVIAAVLGMRDTRRSMAV